MAKYLPIIGEVYTTLESATCAAVGGVNYLLDDKKTAEKWMDAAGNAWTEYTDTNVFAAPCKITHLTLIGRPEAEIMQVADKCLNAAESCINGLPVIGHVKGIVHYAQGDTDKGNKCMESATRTAVVLGAGILTGGLGGVALEGAAIGVCAGAIHDSAATIIDSVLSNEPKLHGTFALIDSDKMTPNELTQTLMGIGGDALQGAVGAKLGQNIRLHSSKSARQNVLQGNLAEEYNRAGVNNPDQAARMTMDAANAGEEAQAGFKKKINGCTTAVEDTANGNTGVGHSGRIRNFRVGNSNRQNTNLAQSDYSTPSHLQQAHPEVQHVGGTPQNACAEHAAFNDLYARNAAYNVDNVRCATVRNTGGNFHTAPRCNNCSAYGAFMGEVVTDILPAEIAVPLDFQIPTVDNIRAGTIFGGGTLVTRNATARNA